MADQFGIPAQFIDGIETRWETSLDDYRSEDYELLWFFTPYGATNPTDFAIANPSSNGDWCTSITLSSQSPGWTYSAKVRNQDSHLVTEVTTGTFELLVVLSELEGQIKAIRDALVEIGRGGKAQSYSIRGRSLSQYSLAELTALYNLLKSELQSEKKQQRHDHGFLHGNFGGAMAHWATHQYQGWR